MSVRYEVEVVGPSEDSGLRAVLRETSMPGAISISFQAEPSFFAAEQIGSLETQTIAVRDTASGKIVGLASRGFKRMFVDGEVRVCAYLNGLRGLPEVRGGTLLARGLRFLRELHGDGKAPFYVTTILDSNKYAKSLLTSRRAGLPVFETFGRLQVFLLPLYTRTNHTRQPSCVVRGVDGDLLTTTVEAVNAFNGRHQFGPHYTADDFKGRTTLLPHFDPSDLYVYQQDSQVTATLGVWDLRVLKQWVVTRYPWRYRLAAPFSSIGAMLGLTRSLPSVGKPVDLLYASFMSYAPGQEDAFADLLRVVLRDWSRRGYTFLAIGVHDGSPLCDLLQSLAVERLSSTVYLVYWPDQLSCSLPAHDLTPYLEIATL